MTRNAGSSIRWRQLLPATFIATTAMLGGSAANFVAVATADNDAQCVNRVKSTGYCCDDEGTPLRIGACVVTEALKSSSPEVTQQAPPASSAKVRLAFRRRPDLVAPDGVTATF